MAFLSVNEKFLNLSEVTEVTNDPFRFAFSLVMTLCIVVAIIGLFNSHRVRRIYRALSQ